jgi:hypothetical protein
MEYADIIKALPPDIAELLHSKLDAIAFPAGISQDEAQELVQSAVEMTKVEMLVKSDEELQVVDSLLSQVAGAAVKALFA